jgi:hypothetical protein
MPVAQAALFAAWNLIPPISRFWSHVFYSYIVTHGMFGSGWLILFLAEKESTFTTMQTNAMHFGLCWVVVSEIEFWRVWPETFIYSDMTYTDTKPLRARRMCPTQPHDAMRSFWSNYWTATKSRHSFSTSSSSCGILRALERCFGACGGASIRSLNTHPWERTRSSQIAACLV